MEESSDDDHDSRAKKTSSNQDGLPLASYEAAISGDLKKAALIGQWSSNQKS